MQLAARFPTFFLLMFIFIPYCTICNTYQTYFWIYPPKRPRKDNPQRNADSGHP